MWGTAQLSAKGGQRIRVRQRLRLSNNGEPFTQEIGDVHDDSREVEVWYAVLIDVLLWHILHTGSVECLPACCGNGAAAWSKPPVQ